MGGTGEEAPAEDGATGMGEEGATDEVGMGEGGATRGSRGDERSHSHSGIPDVEWEWEPFQYCWPYETKISAPGAIERQATRRAEESAGLQTKRAFGLLF